jgi:hypothetical protein
LLRADVDNDKHQCLYENPQGDPPVKMFGRRLPEDAGYRRLPPILPKRCSVPLSLNIFA